MTRRDPWIAALLTAVLFFPGLGLRDLWNPDEARYAEVAREMAQTGSWTVPRLNGEVYSHKPPLFFWTIAASGAVTGGLSEADARVPSALAAVGTIVLVLLLAQRFFGRRAAWASAAVFATCFKVLWQGRFGQIDMLLTFWVTLAMWLWAEGYTRKQPRFYWGFFAATGLATLTKGPVGLLPPLLSIVTFLLLTRDTRELKRLKIGRGLLVWAAVVLAWLVPAGLAAGLPYLEQIVFKQNVTRYADPWHHLQPWYYYLTVIPVDFSPWSLFLPTGLWIAAKRLGGRFRKPASPAERGLLLVLCWVVVTLVFFSISPAKRSVYVLTCYPALALLVGSGLDHARATWPRFRPWVTWPLALLTVLSAWVTAALPFAGPDRWGRELSILGEPFLWVVCGAIGGIGLGALWGLWRSRRGEAVRATVGVAVGMVVFHLALSFYLLPRLDVFKSARGLSQELQQRLEPGESYGIFRRFDAGFIFYTGRFQDELDTPEKLRAYAGRPERVWILVERDELAEMDDPPRLWEVGRDADAEDGYLLMTNNPLP